MLKLSRLRGRQMAIGPQQMSDIVISEGEIDSAKLLQEGYPTMTYSNMKSMAQLIESLNDFSSAMIYGSPSVKTWEKRCADSLAKSRRRRQIEAEKHNDLPWLVGATVLLIMFTFLIALLIDAAARSF